ncbi:hypothetical protein ACHAWF_018573 [Thalassiosira exigua]
MGTKCAALTNFAFSFRGFARRGGDTNVHSHKWGLCFYKGRGVWAFHGPNPASESRLAEFLQLENVHPFQREMWGISFCFAYMKQFAADKAIDCLVSPRANELSDMSCVKIPWVGRSIDVEDKGGPTVQSDWGYGQGSAIVGLDDQYEGTTILNFLLGCGLHVQFAYGWPGAQEGSGVCNGLHYLVWELPFGSAHPSDCDYSLDFGAVSKEDDRVVVIAAAPLKDDEDWVEIG